MPSTICVILRSAPFDGAERAAQDKLARLEAPTALMWPVAAVDAIS
jgi:hypothetical protein